MKHPTATLAQFLSFAATFALIGSLAAQPATSTSTPTPRPTAITPAAPANLAVAAATPGPPATPGKADAPTKQPKIVSKNDPSVVTAPGKPKGSCVNY